MIQEIMISTKTHSYLCEITKKGGGLIVHMRTLNHGFLCPFSRSHICSVDHFCASQTLRNPLGMFRGLMRAYFPPSTDFPRFMTSRLWTVLVGYTRFFLSCSTLSTSKACEPRATWAGVWPIYIVSTYVG